MKTQEIRSADLVEVKGKDDLPSDSVYHVQRFAVVQCVHWDNKAHHSEQVLTDCAKGLT